MVEGKDRVEMRAKKGMQLLPTVRASPLRSCDTYIQKGLRLVPILGGQIRALKRWVLDHDTAKLQHGRAGTRRYGPRRGDRWQNGRWDGGRAIRSVWGEG